jgi:UV DNA damage endonuclease
MSSSKEGPNVRAHADYINADEFMAFVHLAKDLNQDFDVMLEAKQKDQAVHQLMRDLEATGEVEVVDEATIAY